MVCGMVHGAVMVIGHSVRALDVVLGACLKLLLMAMAWLGSAMGVEEARIKRDLVLLEFVGGLCVALIMTRACAAICCAMGHFLQDEKENDVRRCMQMGSFDLLSQLTTDDGH